MWRVEADVHFSSHNRLFRKRIHPLENLSDKDFIKRYRFSKSTVVELSEELRPILAKETNRNCSLPVEMQLCIALRYFADGDFLKEIGDLHGVSDRTVSRCIFEVCDAIYKIHGKYLYWPTEEEMSTQKLKFYRSCGIPRTVGCIDGTQIQIIGPSVDEKIFINRKGKHAINCQVICDHDLKILDFSPKWPGSFHDANVLKNSLIWTRLESGFDGWLLGDSAYPLLPFLIKPYLNPSSISEENFNNSLTKGRSCVERCIGVMKSRFRCLTKPLMFSPSKSARIIFTCGVLHNVAMSKSATLSESIVTIHGNSNDHLFITNGSSGSGVRNQILNQLF